MHLKRVYHNWQFYSTYFIRFFLAISEGKFPNVIKVLSARLVVKGRHTAADASYLILYSRKEEENK